MAHALNGWSSYLRMEEQMEQNALQALLTCSTPITSSEYVKKIRLEEIFRGEFTRMGYGGTLANEFTLCLAYGRP